jgi:cytosine deaminase
MLLIKNANILGHRQIEDILIGDDGRYIEIRAGIDSESVPGAKVIDANKMLAAPTFVNTHMHFDKAYTALQGRESSAETLEDSIHIMHDIKRHYTVEDVKNRAVRAIRECVMYGTTKLRTNVDIDNMANLVGLEGVLAAKEATKDIRSSRFRRRGSSATRVLKNSCGKRWRWARTLPAECPPQSGSTNRNSATLTSFLISLRNTAA